MATFGEIWTGLKQAGGATPYLLVDCAGLDAGAAALPRDACAELECLFTGDLAQELADVAPYLGRIKAFEGEVPGVVEDVLKRHVGMLVVLPPTPEGDGPSFSQLHRHFRKFNVVYDPDGKPLFFRYYDPRVIVDVLTVLEPQQLRDFFGPVAGLVLTGASGAAVRCSHDNGRLLLS